MSKVLVITGASRGIGAATARLGAARGWAVAVNYEKNDFFRTTTGNDLKDTVYGFDLVYKYRRVFATGEYYIRERTPESGAKFNSNGFFGQASYLLTSRRQWELGVRYGQYDPSDLVPANKHTELRGALSYYYGRHNLKVQADFGELTTEVAAGNSIRNKEFRLQSQIVF